MRMLAIPLLLALAHAADSADAAQWTLEGDRGVFRLTERECTVPAAVASVRPEFAHLQRAGTWTRPDGVRMPLCWIRAGRYVFAMDEAGQVHRGEWDDFEEDDPGI